MDDPIINLRLNKNKLQKSTILNWKAYAFDDWGSRLYFSLNIRCSASPLRLGCTLGVAALFPREVPSRSTRASADPMSSISYQGSFIKTRITIRGTILWMIWTLGPQDFPVPLPFVWTLQQSSWGEVWSGYFGQKTLPTFWQSNCDKLTDTCDMAAGGIPKTSARRQICSCSSSPPNRG